jgi:hypothetical protein
VALEERELIGDDGLMLGSVIDVEVADTGIDP